MPEILFDITFSIFFLNILYVAAKWSIVDYKHAHANK